MSERLFNRAVFLDRDGTVIEDKHYLDNPDDISIIPGAIRAVKIFNNLNLRVFIVSNQSGVARGYFNISSVEKINDRLIKLFAESGAFIDKIYFCPHHIEGTVLDYAIDCNCRKPLPGMLFKARDEYSVDLMKSYVIGDKDCDMNLARNVGAISLLVKTGYGNEVDIKPDFTGKDILECALWIKEQFK